MADIQAFAETQYNDVYRIFADLAQKLAYKLEEAPDKESKRLKLAKAMCEKILGGEKPYYQTVDPEIFNELTAVLEMNDIPFYPIFSRYGDMPQIVFAESDINRVTDLHTYLVNSQTKYGLGTDPKLLAKTDFMLKHNTDAMSIEFDFTDSDPGGRQLFLEKMNQVGVQSYITSDQDHILIDESFLCRNDGKDLATAELIMAYESSLDEVDLFKPGDHPFILEADGSKTYLEKVEGKKPITPPSVQSSLVTFQKHRLGRAKMSEEQLHKFTEEVFRNRHNPSFHCALGNSMVDQYDDVKRMSFMEFSNGVVTLYDPKQGKREFHIENDARITNAHDLYQFLQPQTKNIYNQIFIPESGYDEYFVDGDPLKGIDEKGGYSGIEAGKISKNQDNRESAIYKYYQVYSKNAQRLAKELGILASKEVAKEEKALGKKYSETQKYQLKRQKIQKLLEQPDVKCVKQFLYAMQTQCGLSEERANEVLRQFADCHNRLIHGEDLQIFPNGHQKSITQAGYDVHQRQANEQRTAYRQNEADAKRTFSDKDEEDLDEEEDKNHPVPNQQ